MSEQDGSRVEHVVLAQCTGTKRDGAHPARDLYDESRYFRRQRGYAKTADAWFVQSAEYGLIEPDEVIESYDTHAGELSDEERAAWVSGIADDLSDRVPTTATVEILGGKQYADPLVPELEAHGFDVEEPLRGQRIGTRRASLDEMATHTLGEFA